MKAFLRSSKEKIALTPGSYWIGRASDCALRFFQDPDMSRKHAEVVWDGTTLSIKDNDSTNGTFVDGVRLGEETRVLKDKESIRMGETVLIVCMEDDEAQAAAELDKPTSVQ